MSEGAADTTLLLTRLEPARMFPTRRDGTMRKRVAFGTDRVAQLNPLLSFVEDWMKAPGGYVEHMHKGFETVTLVLDGQVSCTDAHGPRELLGAGDVHWVATGRGVMHAEVAEGEGEAHMIQLWLNLPAQQKQAEPRSTVIRAEAVPLVDAPGAIVRVIAGEFGGVPGAAHAASGARVLDVHLEAGANLSLPIASGQLGIAYVAKGELTIGEHLARAGDVVHFSSKLKDALRFAAAQTAHLVVVNASPMLEPVVVNGPFVMNTAAQIQQAYAEYRAGTFAAPAHP
ncbi:MAG: pirin-like C-terminal cupin domain-containing protein [Archangium sp.]|nr:pirin-like C-terminal cupin domain-containing protein [Archangium sp.]